jgi:lipocalin
MARTPTIDEARYRELVGKVGAMGYDVNKLVRISHRTAAGR